jgi:hypothetical protein
MNTISLNPSDIRNAIVGIKLAKQTAIFDSFVSIDLGDQIVLDFGNGSIFKGTAMKIEVKPYYGDLTIWHVHAERSWK